MNSAFCCLVLPKRQEGSGTLSDLPKTSPLTDAGVDTETSSYGCRARASCPPLRGCLLPLFPHHVSLHRIETRCRSITLFDLAGNLHISSNSKYLPLCKINILHTNVHMHNHTQSILIINGFYIWECGYLFMFFCKPQIPNQHSGHFCSRHDQNCGNIWVPGHAHAHLRLDKAACCLQLSYWR